MIHSSPLRVKAAVREQHGATRTIPFAFRADPIALDGLGLNRTARAVFVLLLDNARSRGWRSRLSNGTLARILGCCEMTVGRALLALERAGLIARDYTHGGRVRTGIRVTWEALQQSCGTERACVQQECGTGSTAAREGFNIPVELTRAPHQSEEQTAPILSQDEDPEEAARFAQLGPAGYLRAMIEAGRKDARRASAPPPTSRIGDAPAKGRSEPDATPAKVAAVGRPPSRLPGRVWTIPGAKSAGCSGISPTASQRACQDDRRDVAA
ncbi:helix-turn-helix domain-containing protein [Planctomyces sp. SH-PL62]|uniref:helix-turn-helix domain-containing protein n=1 Tax=Planctomyces sp. SH-PL62 TaxID=1636152 RepID=UPI00078E46E7|nr:helix-turn-helix domain-containing protein [Planctomyces sp. SH-PL62]AMV41053.1 hypothetical protein VT85_26695 [Planctomyces sp. SH-PL62]